MKRDRFVMVVTGLVALILSFAAGWGTGRTDECEHFATQVEGYISALTDQGVPEEDIAPRSSAALRDEQPDGCDVL